MGGCVCSLIEDANDDGLDQAARLEQVIVEARVSGKLQAAGFHMHTLSTEILSITGLTEVFSQFSVSNII